MTIADRIWNRAALEGGGASPGSGDRALVALLRVHSLAMNGGVHHALECVDDSELAAAVDGYDFFGLYDVATLFRRVPDNPIFSEPTDDTEAFADLQYRRMIPDDSFLADRFQKVLLARPDEFAPLPT